MFEDKLKEKYEVNVKAVDDAIFSLRSMMEMDGEIDLGESVCRHAIYALFKYYKINKPVSDSQIETLNDAEKLMAKNDLICLKMTLGKNWWKQCSAPVLAMDCEGRFVAAIPGVMSYRLVDPISGKLSKVNSENVKMLQPQALNIFPCIPKKPIDNKEFRKYCKSIIPNGRITATVLFCAVATLLSMFIPIANKSLFSEVIPSGVASGILPICGFLLASSISALLFELTRNFALARIKDKFNTVLQAALMNRMLYLPASFFKSYSSGNLGMRVMAADNICQLMTNQMMAGLASAVFSSMNILIAIMYAKSMLPVVTVTIVLGVLEGILLWKLAVKRYRKSIPNSVAAQDFAYNAILGIQKIKNCRAEQRAFNQWATRFSKSEVVDKYGKLLTEILICFCNFLAIFFAWKSNIPVSDFVAFMSAYGVMIFAITYAMPFLSSIAGIAPNIKLLEPILQTEPEDKSESPLVEDISGNIDINHVSFKYGDGAQKVLDDVTLHIPSGQNVALVGKSGCGKSTLMRMLLGFETPHSGSIFYGHYDISKVNIGSLRQFVGFCPQSIQVFPGSIAENIRFASIGCTDEEIWEAARIACLDEDIRKMPKQLDTFIGEGGSGLSGGQCQRLLIARAVISKPKVLFLDEATSALDNITQKRVIENLSQFGCTRIAIAHRLSTVMNCDRIIVLDGGHVIEDGAPAELIEKKGFFYQLSKRQL